MKPKTENIDHWILDRKYSDQKDFSYQDGIILNTIQAAVNKKKENFIEGTSLTKEENPQTFRIPQVFDLKEPSRFKNYICKAQNWIGHITDINESGFSARLVDKNFNNTYEVADFDFDEVSDGDKPLLKIGSVFYWGVGYANQNGQILKQSILRFKRSANIDVSDFDKISDKASDLNNSINWA